MSLRFHIEPFSGRVAELGSLGGITRTSFMASWSDIDRALVDGPLERLSTDTLAAFSEVRIPPSENPVFHAKFDQTQKHIRHILSTRTSQTEQATAMDQFRQTFEQTERHHHDQIAESRRQSARASLIAGWALVVAVGSLVVAAWPLFRAAPSPAGSTSSAHSPPGLPSPVAGATTSAPATSATP